MQKPGLNVTINLPFSHTFCSFTLPFHYLLCLLLLHAVSFTQAHTTVRPAMFMRQKVKERFSVTARSGSSVYECRYFPLCCSRQLYKSQNCGDRLECKKKIYIQMWCCFHISENYHNVYAELFASSDSEMTRFYGNTHNTERASKYLITQLTQFAAIHTYMISCNKSGGTKVKVVIIPLNVGVVRVFLQVTCRRSWSFH